MPYEDLYHIPTKEEKEKNQIDNFNKVQIGDIYVNTWGYDQTNQDFYQVVDKRGKSVYFRKINGKIVVNKYDRGYCIPLKDDFVECNHYNKD